MRLLLFAFMIAVLPLRGWMGDAMASEMLRASLRPAQSTTKIIAANAHETGAGSHLGDEAGASEATQEMAPAHDCAGQTPEDACPAENAYCASCAAACQVGQTLALAPVVADLNAVFSAYPLPRAASKAFASADVASGQKPPIS
ncbi:MAG: hypothetical protein JJD98_16030 [Polaromonas sp.]|nr:hypothetical protein [Polaromonas sp.]